MSEKGSVEATAIAGARDSSAADRVERVYGRMRDPVFRLALRYGAGDRAFAEDMTHDVFLRLLGAIDTLDDDDALGGWLYRVTTNLCLTRLSRDRFRRSVLSLLGIEDRAATTPEKEVSHQTELRKTLETIQALPPKERVVLTMLHLDGKSQNEIASILGHSKGYISKLVDRATARVRAAGWEVPHD